ncbi:MAG: hypothetical protein IJ746_04355 [Ruminococcus sp.]|nr:hypothetical protein [Ruminococcus sp.]
MTKYLTTYRRYILEQLESGSADLERLIGYHEKHLEFFMHERLVHLLVMILFALLTMACFLLIAVTEKIILVPLAVALMCLLIPYIKHYYFLENTVQALYKDYDRMRMMLDGEGTKELYE